MAQGKIRVRLKSYDSTIIDAAAQKVVEVAKRNGSKVSGPIPLPTDREIVTILRAVHKYKDSREQFEMRTHKRLIDILDPQAKTVAHRSPQATLFSWTYACSTIISITALSSTSKPLSRSVLHPRAQRASRSMQAARSRVSSPLKQTTSRSMLSKPLAMPTAIPL